MIDSAIGIVFLFFISGLIGGVTGFGFASIAILIVLKLGSQGFGLVVVLSLLARMIQIHNHRIQLAKISGSFLAKDQIPLILGGVSGLLPGQWLMANLEPSSLRVSLASLIGAAGLIMFCRPHRMAKFEHQSKKGSLFLLLGFLGGICGGLASFPLAPLIIYFQYINADRHSVHQFIQPFALIIQIVSFVSTLFIGNFWTSSVVDLLPYTAAATVVGTVVGINFSKIMSDFLHSKTQSLILLMSATILLFFPIIRAV